MNIQDKDWQEVLEAEPGTIMKDFEHNDVRCLIMRGPFSLCAYVGVPDAHPLAGFDCYNIPLRVHFGLTFAKLGTKDNEWPEKYYWYGWDYSHCTDFSTYETDSDQANLKKWTVSMVEEELKDATYDFSRLMILAEKIILRQHKYLIAK